LPLTAAVAAGTARVGEVDGGRVSQLRVENRGDALLFAMAGELVSGGRQDRVLNASMLIAPGAGATVAVSCVEQHRWEGGAGRQRHFTPARAAASPAVRSTVHGTMITSLRTSGRRRTNQQAVWRRVSDTLQRSGTHQATRTGALTGGLAHQRGRLDEYARACAAPAHQPQIPQLGLALFTPGTPSAGLHGFSSLDCFGSPALLDHYASRLVRGAALEALSDAPCATPIAPPDATGNILAALADQRPLVTRPAAGHAPGAQELHYAFDGIVASVLCYQGHPVHLAVTPTDEPSDLPSDVPSDASSDVSGHAHRAVSGHAPSDHRHAARYRDLDSPAFHEPHAQLRIQTDGQRDRFPRLAPGTYLVGRGQSALVVIDDPTVSRRHAELVITAQGGTVRDLGSTNGTFVNGEPVLYASLQPGDRVGLGKHTQLRLLEHRTVWTS